MTGPDDAIGRAARAAAASRAARAAAWAVLPRLGSGPVLAHPGVPTRRGTAVGRVPSPRGPWEEGS